MSLATPVTETPAWRALRHDAARLEPCHLRELFAADPRRFQRMSMQAAGLLLDYSKQRFTPAVVDRLAALAEARGVGAAITAMFAGEPINQSEGRAAWHVALRAPPGLGYPPAVQEELGAMEAFVARVRGADWRGFRGEPITDLVNIGTGGSDLGPRLVCTALHTPGAVPRAHFVANVDPDEMDSLLATLDPARTLFVVVSKTFATPETLANARAARMWIEAAGARASDIARHFVAVSTQRQAATAFGIGQVFGFWDWVGGRYSLWSSVGLVTALALGMDRFRALLAGAHAMDEHFRSAALPRNLPVLLALTGIWNRNFLGLSSLVVVPYAHRLRWFPAWLGQLEMESNGKAVGTDGARVSPATAPAVWGSTGTPAQHAYFQMLHQSNEVLPVDFLLPLCGQPDEPRARALAANCLAQSQALMQGRDPEHLRSELAAAGLSGNQLDRAVAQRGFSGNRPSNTLLLQRLDAATLGALLAAYEHKTFVQGVIWGINSFDQWGVELGKRLAGQIERDLSGQAVDQHDSSSAGLLEYLRRGSLEPWS